MQDVGKVEKRERATLPVCSNDHVARPFLFGEDRYDLVADHTLALYKCGSFDDEPHDVFADSSLCLERVQQLDVFAAPLVANVTSRPR